MKKILTSILLLIGLFIVGCNSEDDALDKQLSTMIADNNLALPKMIDSDTRLDRLEKLTDTLGVNYIYTIVNYTTAEIQQEDYHMLKPTLANIICNQPEFDFFVSNNIMMRYSYYGNDDSPAFSVTIQPSIDCK